MAQTRDLTSGGIFRSLFGLALPIIGASFIQMTYNLTDMFWLGQLGGKAVAAVGAAAFFSWMSTGIAYVTKIGVEVTVSQSLGGGYVKRARMFASHAVSLAFLIALFFLILTQIFADSMIGFFGLDAAIAQQGALYLRIVAPGLLFTFLNQTFSGIYNASGNSKIPLYINGCGLLLNMTLDPLLIYGIGFFPQMGIVGAAIATTLSQGLVTALFVFRLYSFRSPLGKLPLLTQMRHRFVKRILSIGFPVSLQSVLFCGISMITTQLAAKWGYPAMVAQSVGGQIEAVSWMSAGGFSTALGAFVGQNFGARKFDRIKKAFRITLIMGIFIGLVAGFVFYFFGSDIFFAFVKDNAAAFEGGRYLRILAYSQVFMLTEMVTAGAFNGLGRTKPPTVIGITFNAMRIPLAYALVTIPILGVQGVWWSITISSIIKGIVSPLWYRYKVKL
ncbi:MAG: MATE family efflux transporter [Bacteroidales bacterium]|nr:MATE family efflux transporter [Bacteroidales bacterium]